MATDTKTEYKVTNELWWNAIKYNKPVAIHSPIDMDVPTLPLGRICTFVQDYHTWYARSEWRIAQISWPLRGDEVACFTAWSSVVGLTIRTAADWGLEKKAMREVLTVLLGASGLLPSRNDEAEGLFNSAFPSFGQQSFSNKHTHINNARFRVIPKTCLAQHPTHQCLLPRPIQR